jgi:Protein of unknown function DUF104
MANVRARFDGKVFVPDVPVNLPKGEAVVLTIKRAKPKRSSRKKSALDLIVERAVDDGLPADLGYQHDHYLYGLPKKPDPCQPQ